MTNGILLQYFHWYLPSDGSLWNQIKNDAQRLQDLGFSTIWLPPAFKGSSGGYSIGYDTYDLYDLGEFDQKGSVRTKYGTRDEYIEAVNAINACGMQAMVDIVINHKAGGDETEHVKAVRVNEDNRNEIISEPIDIEAFTRFTFPGRQNKYSDFVWDHRCFIGVDYAYNLSEDGIFRILSGHEDSWQEVVSEEKGNYDYLMYNDIDYRNPAVRDELNRWAKWYWDQANFGAVRLDAVKHVNPDFYMEWLQSLRDATGREIFAVGEYWAPGFVNLLVNYIETTQGTMSLFDSSLHKNIHEASEAGADYNLCTIFDETLVQAMPQKAVTIVANHDTQPLQTLESPIQPWFKPIAYALILLRSEGFPCVFYPDLYGASYTDTGGDGNEHEIWLPKIDELETLLIARRDHAFGMQRDYFDDPNCIGWTREGDESHTGCAVMVSNAGGGAKFMEMGSRYAGKTFVDLLQKIDASIIINEEGWAEFYAPPGSVSVWIEQKEE